MKKETLKKLRKELDQLDRTQLENMELATERMIQDINDELKVIDMIVRICQEKDKNSQEIADAMKKIALSKKKERKRWIELSQVTSKKI